jgi:hypothetical protein
VTSVPQDLFFGWSKRVIWLLFEDNRNRLIFGLNGPREDFRPPPLKGVKEGSDKVAINFIFVL